MVWTTKVLDESQTVQVTCAGRLSLDDLTMIAVETAHLIRGHGHGKVLVELSDARLDFAADGLSELLDIYLEHHIPLTTRIGIVLKAGRPTYPFSKFLETAKQYGFKVEFLVDGKQREGWLS